jgi:hypothetical protein
LGKDKDDSAMIMICVTGIGMENRGSPIAGSAIIYL